MITDFFEAYVSLKKALSPPYCGALVDLLIDASADPKEHVAIFSVTSPFGGQGTFSLPMSLGIDAEREMNLTRAASKSLRSEPVSQALWQRFAGQHAYRSLEVLRKKKAPAAASNRVVEVQTCRGISQIVCPGSTPPHPPASFSFHVIRGNLVAFCSPARTNLSPVHQSIVNAALSSAYGVESEERDRSIVVEALQRRVSQSPSGFALCYISGPSGAGKTTNSNRLASMLKTRNVTSTVLPLDSYQTSRRLFPLHAQGGYDMESFQCLRADAIRRDIAALMQGKSVRLPVFDFGSGEFTEEAGQVLKLSRPGVLFIEGLHAFHPDLSVPGIPAEWVYKVFTMPIPRRRYCESTVGIGHRELRLLRRLHRDHMQRRNTPQGNLTAWPSILEGEATWILPHLPTANFVFNNAMDEEVPRMRAEGIDGMLETHAKDFPLAQNIRLLIREVANAASGSGGSKL